MSRVEDLKNNYERFVVLPWQSNLAPAQRVWMAVYPPEDERNLRLHIADFGNATIMAGYEWALIDVSDEFEKWMAAHEYREAYFDQPKLMEPELVGFFDQLVENVRSQIQAKSSMKAIIGIIGAAELYGLSEYVKVSALIERVEDLILGRLLVFFPGEVEGNNYRLMGAQDGWNYHAVVIPAEKGQFS